MDEKGQVTRLLHIKSFIGSTSGDFSESVANDRALIFYLVRTTVVCT